MHWLSCFLSWIFYTLVLHLSYIFVTWRFNYLTARHLSVQRLYYNQCNGCKGIISSSPIIESRLPIFIQSNAVLLFIYLNKNSLHQSNSIKLIDAGLLRCNLLTWWFLVTKSLQMTFFDPIAKNFSSQYMHFI